MNTHLVMAAMLLSITVKIGFEPAYWTDADIAAAEYCGDDDECLYEYVKEWQQSEADEQVERREQARGASTK